MGEAVQAGPLEERRGAQAKAAPARRKQALPGRLGQVLVAPEWEVLRARPVPTCRQHLAALVWNLAPPRGSALQRLIAAGATIGDRTVVLPRFAPTEHGPSASRPRSAQAQTPFRLRAPQRQRRRQANALIQRCRAGTTTARFAGAVAVTAASSTPFANRSILPSGLARNLTPRVRTHCHRRVLRAMHLQS